MASSSSERVSAVFTLRTPPAVAVGDFVQFIGTSCVIRLDPGSPEPEPGETVVVEFGDQGLPIVLAHFDHANDGDLHLDIDQFRRRDPREYPRVHAGLDLRYRVAPLDMDDSALEAWAADGTEPDDGVAWRSPSPFMDMSATGLGFDDLPLCEEEDRLLLAFSLPDCGAPWRAVARVVRVLPIHEEDRGPDPQVPHRVAVEFLLVPEDARRALIEKTIELLRLPGEEHAPDGDHE